MINRISPLIGLGIVVAAIAVPSGQHAPQQAKSDDVGAMFDKNCASCHVRPDARFNTDKAWIARIAGTT